MRWYRTRCLRTMIRPLKFRKVPPAISRSKTANVRKTPENKRRSCRSLLLQRLRKKLGTGLRRPPAGTSCRRPTLWPDPLHMHGLAHQIHGGVDGKGGLFPSGGQNFVNQARFRSKMSASFCLGGLAGVPWITLPLAEIDGAPLGVSLISACGTDAWLLELSKPLVQNR